jgi:Family of unknown function (DUF5681)
MEKTRHNKTHEKVSYGSKGLDPESSNAQAMVAEYAVGYCRPPIATRFRPGQSGNRKGRPKGARRKGSIAQETLEQKSSVKDGTGPKASVRDLAYQAIGDKAKSGDIKSLNFLLTRESEQQQPLPPEHPYVRAETALDIIRLYLEHQQATKGEQR